MKTPSVPMPREHVLPNGLRIITLSTPDIPTARMSVYVRTGAFNDPPGKEGISHYLEHVICQGSHGNRSFDASQKQFKRWGGQLNARTSLFRTEYGFFANSHSILNEHLNDAAALVLDLLQHPRLSEADAHRERNAIKSENAQVNNKLGNIAAVTILKAAYAENGPAHGSIGKMEALDRITARDLRDYWRDHYVPSNITIAIQGQASHEELLKIVTDKLTIFAEYDKTAPKSKPIIFKGGDERIPVTGANGISYRMEFGQSTPANMTEREYYTLRLLCNLVGGALFRYVRGNKGLAYDIGTAPSAVKGLTVGFDSVDPPADVLQAVMEVLSHPERYLTQDDLDDTKRSRAILYQKMFDFPLDVSLDYYNNAMHGGPVVVNDELARMYQDITLEEIHALASRIFSQPFAFAACGDPKLVEQVPPYQDIKALYTGQPPASPCAPKPEKAAVIPYDLKSARAETNLERLKRRREFVRSSVATHLL